ncbi:MAG: adenylosuccinate lyase [Spirochaetales bacterium]|nr:adenylosuccinate lyase [Spirochaetales bacterium]
MKQRNIFTNISPLDHRYSMANSELYDALARHLSEDGAIKYAIQVEMALLKSIIPYVQGISGKEAIIEKLDSLSDEIDPEEVYEEEEKTQHNIRALVNVIKQKVPPEVAHLVHLGATSMDVLDTVFSLRIKKAVQEVVLPLLKDVLGKMMDIAGEHAATPQVGRTHGQHAVPITFGHTFSEYISRLGKSIKRIAEYSEDLRGKLAGAVGAYNATSMVVTDPEALEKTYLAYLGLKPSDHSTQIIEPEYHLRLLVEINIAFGVIANLADDLRNLQRTEIGEVKEGFIATQVGSSTMPQKRNPWNSENIKSMWKAYAPRVMTFFMDQISEHQRDLTNSASSRFVMEYIAGFAFAARRLLKVLSSLYVDKERMMKNIRFQGDMVLAEPAYILLALAGVKDAHEVIRVKTLACEEKNITLAQALMQDTKVWAMLEKQYALIAKNKAEDFFNNPHRYCGIAEKKSQKIIGEAKQILADVKAILGE